MKKTNLKKQNKKSQLNPKELVCNEFSNLVNY